MAVIIPSDYWSCCPREKVLINDKTTACSIWFTGDGVLPLQSLDFGIEKKRNLSDKLGLFVLLQWPFFMLFFAKRIYSLPKEKKNKNNNTTLSNTPRRRWLKKKNPLHHKEHHSLKKSALQHSCSKYLEMEYPLKCTSVLQVWSKW